MMPAAVLQLVLVPVSVSVLLPVQLIPMPQQQVQLLPGACCQGLQEQVCR